MQDIPIYIINLENRKERKEKLIKELIKHKITNYSFTPAVHGHTIDVETMLAKKEVDFQCRRLKSGEYGCYLSHQNIYQTILEKENEIALVLEDDVYFPNGFNQKLRRLLGKIEAVPWDVCYLGINCHQDNGDCYEGEYVGDPQDGIYYPKNKMWGTHAYLIKKESLKWMMPLLTPIVLPIDVTLMYHDQIKKLTLVKNIVYVRFKESDTQGIL